MQQRSPRIPSPAVWSSIYGFALAALVISHKWTYAVIELFIRPGYTLGTHERDWTSWHAVGCGFVGLINALSLKDGDWGPSARRSLTLATAAIFSIWSVQNLLLMFADPPRFAPFMWAHVLACGVTGLWNLAHFVELRRAAAR
jgi:hypothetical protein